MLHAVVMAGGSGTRFWPMSRAALPKQLLSLVTGQTLLTDTVRRLSGLVPEDRIQIITNQAYAGQIVEMLPAVPQRQIVAEPCGRDTAPCIGLAAALIHRADPDGVMAVLPADHVVGPAEAFRAALERADRIIGRHGDHLLTFGVPPTRPATGYGYIERGAPLGDEQGVSYYGVQRFREKPDEETARAFLDAGTFLWNAGIFVFRAGSILERMERYLPELAAALPELAERYEKTGELTAEAYGALPRISIDYGVLERDEDVIVLETSFDWDDVGSFAALERVLEPDPAGNWKIGNLAALDAGGNIVLSREDHQVALIGVSDLVVVQTPDATLVCRKEDSERVKELVARLADDGLERLL